MKAVFLDRDGTINEEVNHANPRIKYAPFSPEEFKLLPMAAEAIKLLNDSGLKVIVVGNQAGVAKGYFSEGTLEQITEKMRMELSKKEAFLDGVYYCLHHPDFGSEKYRKVCDCRKPKPGLLKRAAADFKINLKESYLVGDKLTDIEAGKSVGCKTILVLTGFGEQEQNINKKVKPDHVVSNLYEAVNLILKIGEIKLKGGMLFDEKD